MSKIKGKGLRGPGRIGNKKRISLKPRSAGEEAPGRVGKKKNIIGAPCEKDDKKLLKNEEVREVRKRLSPVNVDFLDYVEKTPGCFDPAHFESLELNDDLFRLQPWPTFISAETKTAFRRVGVGLFNLLKQIPGRVFNNDLQRMSAFYEAPVDVLELQLEGVTTEHMDNLVGRGDFIVTGEGIKCIEYNVSSSLGGLEIPAWETLYLETPILKRFLEEYGIKTKNGNIQGLFLKHALRCCIDTFGLSQGRFNIAMVMSGYDEMVGENGRIDATREYLNRLYREILRQEDHSLKGEVLICDYPQLDIDDNRIFLNGRRIHLIQEGYNGMVSSMVMSAFKAGNLCLFNGPVTKLMSNKLNLTLLSDPAYNSVFSDEERRLIDRHVPWTRKIGPGPTVYKGETVDDLEHFIRTNRERLVMKPALGYGGDSVRVGNKTSPQQWEQCLDNALRKKDWIVQELEEAPPGLYLSGTKSDYHEMVWGFFIFGTRYTGTWLRVMHRARGRGVINCHEGAAVSIVFDV